MALFVTYHKMSSHKGIFLPVVLLSFWRRQFRPLPPAAPAEHSGSHPAFHTRPLRHYTPLA